MRATFDFICRCFLIFLWLSFGIFCGFDGSALAQHVADASSASSSIKSVDDLVLHDRQRNKDLHLRVTYVPSLKPLPVIVFSHGAGGSKDSYRYLINDWAKNGYFVIQPTHADSIGKPANPRDGMRAMIKIIRALPTDYQAWNNRFRDVSFVIDSLPQIQKDVGADVSLDPSRLGVGGHSYGAFTTVIVAGGKIPSGDKTAGQTGSDPRVKAILAISPQSVRRRESDFGFDHASAWQSIKIPAMYMTGTYDQTGWTKASDRKQSFNNSAGGDKYFVIVDGANHMTFAGGRAPKSGSESSGIAARLSRRFGPSEQGDHEKMLDSIESVSTTFWDTYLKDDAAAKKKIQATAAPQFGPLIQVESK